MAAYIHRMMNRILYRRSVLMKPVVEQYELVIKNGDALLLRHLLVDNFSTEYQLLQRSGLVLLEHFRKIEILPSLHENDIFFRKKLLPGVRHNKNPDYRLDGVYWELECPTYPYSYKKIDQRIRKGYQQADKLILFFEKPVNGFTVQKALSDRFGINKDFKEAIVIVNTKIVSHIKK